MIQRIDDIFISCFCRDRNITFYSAMDHERRKGIFFYAKSVLCYTFGFKHDDFNCKCCSYKKDRINLSLAD
jgi:hypothetical protein